MADGLKELSGHLFAIIAARLEVAHEAAMAAQSGCRLEEERVAIIARLSKNLQDIEALISAAAVIEAYSEDCELDA